MSTTEPVTFDSLGLPEPLLKALARAGYTAPTPIQAETIPPLLEGRDVLGQAATGTGKTAAFALPILSKLTAGASKPFETQALVLVPTRELALQVTESMKKYSDAMGVSVLAIYGGQEFTVQLRPLKRGVDVVVATPGRAIDHLKRKTLKLDRVTTVILDEADEMLDMGFAEDLEVILSALPQERQVALFSATMPSRILKIAERQMKNPVRVSIARATTHGEGQKVRQVAYVVPRRQKIEALLRVLEVEQPVSALVFCRTRADVDDLAGVLEEKGFAVAALHGGLSQDQRDRVMKKFKSGAVKYVVATDVAARGIHVDNLSHVINADVPTSPEVYVHRIGRTGRAGREGTAIVFAEPGEVRLIKGLERASGGRIQQLPVPTAEAVKTKKVKLTQKAVQQAVEAGGGAAMRAWVDSLGDALPATAAAAFELLHRAMHNEAPEEAPVQTAAQALAGTRHDEGQAKAPRASAARHSGKADSIRAEGSESVEASPSRVGSASRSHEKFVRGDESRGAEARPSAGRGSYAAGSRGGTEAGEEGRAPRASASRHSGGDEVRAPRASAARASATRQAAGEDAKPPRASASRAVVKSATELTPSERAEQGLNGEESGASRASAVRAHERAQRDEARPPRASASKGPKAFERPNRTYETRSNDFASKPARVGGLNDFRASRAEPSRPAAPFARSAKPPEREFRDRAEERQAHKDAGPSRGKPGDTVTLWVSAGTDAGIRPGDLVGAIANEAGLHSKQIGPIVINEAFSLVGVPAVAVEAVIDALHSSKLRGRKVKVRREKT